jgi:hypothetical protein
MSLRVICRIFIRGIRYNSTAEQLLSERKNIAQLRFFEKKTKENKKKKRVCSVFFKSELARRVPAKSVCVLGLVTACLEANSDERVSIAFQSFFFLFFSFFLRFSRPKREHSQKLVNPDEGYAVLSRVHAREMEPLRDGEEPLFTHSRRF